MKRGPLKLAEVTTFATTYRFTDPSGHGWGAYCTVNDQTGELIINSDWGSWTYMWSPDPKHIGNATLTHFIGERGGVDYIAMKLLGRRGAVCFSAEATTKHLHGMIAKRRLDDGQSRMRRMRSYGSEKDQAAAVRAGLCDVHFSGRHYLTKEMARDLWDQLGSIAADLGGGHGDDSAAESLYIERASQLEDLRLVTEEVYEEAQHEQSNDYKILHDVILPALVAACAARVVEVPAYVAAKAAFVAKREADRTAAGQGGAGMSRAESRTP